MFLKILRKCVLVLPAPKALCYRGQISALRFYPLNSVFPNHRKRLPTVPQYSAPAISLHVNICATTRSIVERQATSPTSAAGLPVLFHAARETRLRLQASCDATGKEHYMRRTWGGESREPRVKASEGNGSRCGCWWWWGEPHRTTSKPWRRVNPSGVGPTWSASGWTGRAPQDVRRSRWCLLAPSTRGVACGCICRSSGDGTA